jgi:hypothetical protein
MTWLDGSVQEEQERMFTQFLYPSFTRKIKRAQLKHLLKDVRMDSKTFKMFMID